MRAAFWLLALFSLAVVLALFAQQNPGSVTLFWPPYRFDISLNFFLLIAFFGTFFIYIVINSLQSFLKLPIKAKQWRLQSKSNSMLVSVVDSLMHLTAGRYVRARKSAQYAIELSESLLSSDNKKNSVLTTRLHWVANLLAAESSHALQDKVLRQSFLNRALEQSKLSNENDSKEGLYLRATFWSIQDHDLKTAEHWLAQLPQGASRRVLALRLRFRIARMKGQSAEALAVMRLLLKHRVFSHSSGESLITALASELLGEAKDAQQLEKTWRFLDAHEKSIARVGIAAAQRCLDLDGDNNASTVRAWLLPAWEQMVASKSTMHTADRVQLVRILEGSFFKQDGTPERAWLSRIESSQLANTRDPLLQYLAGVMCARLKLWGKAEVLLKQAYATLKDADLKRNTENYLLAIKNER